MSGVWRCLFWVQSLLGSGHLRRALAAGRRVRGAGRRGRPGQWRPAGAWPRRSRGRAGAAAADQRAADMRLRRAGRRVGGRRSRRRLWAERRRTLLEPARPTSGRRSLVTEMFPFGRRAFRGELLPLLEAARALRPRPLVVASVRDVLVSKTDAGALCLDGRRLRRAWYDRVLVHGDERLIPFAASFPLAERTRRPHRPHRLRRIRARPAPRRRPRCAPAVLVSAGGGAVGERAAAHGARCAAADAGSGERALAACRRAEPRRRRLCRARRAELPDGCTLARYRADLASLDGAVPQVSVSQAGYNTVVEGLAGRRAHGAGAVRRRRRGRADAACASGSPALGLADVWRADARRRASWPRRSTASPRRPRPDAGPLGVRRRGALGRDPGGARRRRAA